MLAMILLALLSEAPSQTPSPKPSPLAAEAHNSTISSDLPVIVEAPLPLPALLSRPVLVIPKPKVELRIHPHVLLQSVSRPKPIILFLRITDTNDELWCPGVRWFWPGGTQSYEEGDCTPWEETAPADRANQSWTQRVILPPGEWTLAVALEKNGRKLRELAVNVVVR